MKRIQFTSEGLEKLKKEHQELLAKRPAAVHELTTARDMGDRSENAAYKSGRQKLSGLDRRIRQLEHVLKLAVIVEKKSTDSVQIGSVVKIINTTGERTFTIVGGYESDLLEGKISCYSPIGKTLMRRRINDEVVAQTPRGNIVYKILEIK